MKYRWMAILLGIHSGNVLCFSPHDYQGISADGDSVTDTLSDGLTDESDDIWTERTFLRFWTFGKFHPAVLVGIFTVSLADG